ncbi:MAG: type II toxin-antitoxin system RelE/ParE family toxin [Flavobacteriaceae bacterium]|nr:type II toxin-antitoxin system RelE/ParE family toxin [Flavobacteriaceae bacterium]
MKPKYRIELLKEAVDFLNALDEKAREKIYYNLKKAQIFNDNTLFKKLNDEIWEFRTLYKRTQYRLFAFWNKTDKKDTLVIATHGIEKKTQKTPKKEINKAENLRKQYFDELKK